ncbi:MAG: ABC transporter permease subunit [Chloroflexota bacterium]|nr:sugar ABC transporter permease [Chloroflexia bacterium]MDQ3443412.1 ABC transporter permease subunit [Chloroflexota bacterium]
MDRLDIQPTATVQPPVPRSISARKVGRVEAMRINLRRSWQLYAMLFLPLLWLAVFAYIPMWGAQIAFRNYVPSGGFAGISSAEWIGLEHFTRFFNSYNFWPIMRNTIVLNVYSLVAGFPLPIILALALNYIGRVWFKKTVQLVSYAPYFISVVVMVGILFQLLASGGMINQLLGQFGIDPILFMSEPGYWKSIYVWSGIWQTVGFNCIIYLAALAGIDPTLHEAAILDGANKLQRMRDIDLPGIMPVAIILLILNMGSLLSTGFEKVILMQNSLNRSTSEVIDSYVYWIGLGSDIPQFAYAAAIGLFKSVIGLVLLYTVNLLARRLQGSSLW